MWSARGKATSVALESDTQLGAVLGGREIELLDAMMKSNLQY